MNAQTYRPSTIEALKALWVALPAKASNDGADGDPRERQRAILDAYCFALSEFSNDAIWNTINNLRTGKIEEASKHFCPKAPELAAYVRSEQARLDAIKSRPAIPYQPTSRPWTDWREIHINRAFKARRKFIEHCTLDQMHKAGRGKYPVGSTWYWSLGPLNTSLGSYYGPPDSATSDAEIWGPNREHLPTTVQIHV